MGNARRDVAQLALPLAPKHLNGLGRACRDRRGLGEALPQASWRASSNAEARSVSAATRSPRRVLGVLEDRLRISARRERRRPRYQPDFPEEMQMDMTCPGKLIHGFRV